jgi:hypothetical protein
MKQQYQHITAKAVGGTAHNSSQHREQTPYTLLCGKHIKRLQGQSMVKQQARLKAQGLTATEAHSGMFYCRVCDVPANAPISCKRATSLERASYHMLATHFPHILMECERPCHIPGEKAHRRLDVWLSSIMLAIEIDGPYHFEPMGFEKVCKRKCDEEWEHVVERDKAMHDAVVAGSTYVHRLIRLHHMDQHAWHGCIAQAVRMCQDAHIRFVMYSASYMRENVIVRQC